MKINRYFYTSFPGRGYYLLKDIEDKNLNIAFFEFNNSWTYSKSINIVNTGKLKKFYYTEYSFDSEEADDFKRKGIVFIEGFSFDINEITYLQINQIIKSLEIYLINNRSKLLEKENIFWTYQKGPEFIEMNLKKYKKKINYTFIEGLLFLIFKNKTKSIALKGNSKNGWNLLINSINQIPFEYIDIFNFHTYCTKKKYNFYLCENKCHDIFFDIDNNSWSVKTEYPADLKAFNKLRNLINNPNKKMEFLNCIKNFNLEKYHPAKKENLEKAVTRIWFYCKELITDKYSYNKISDIINDYLKVQDIKTKINFINSQQNHKILISKAIYWFFLNYSIPDFNIEKKDLSDIPEAIQQFFKCLYMFSIGKIPEIIPVEFEKQILLYLFKDRIFNTWILKNYLKIPKIFLQRCTDSLKEFQIYIIKKSFIKPTFLSKYLINNIKKLRINKLRKAESILDKLLILKGINKKIIKELKKSDIHTNLISLLFLDKITTTEILQYSLRIKKLIFESYYLRFGKKKALSEIENLGLSNKIAKNIFVKYSLFEKIINKYRRKKC